MRILALLIALHVAAQLFGVAVHSPTSEELLAVVSGLYLQEHGCHDIYRVVPPLVPLVASLPVGVHEYRTAWHLCDISPGARPEFLLARDFAQRNACEIGRYVGVARLACLPFTVLGALACFLLARNLYGTPSGLLSATLWCGSPLLLGYGHLVSTDVAAAALAVAYVYLLRRWLREGDWRYATTAGVVLGFSQLAKASLLPLVPISVILWLTDRYPRSERVRQGKLVELWLVLCLGLLVVNSGYLFTGTCRQLQSFAFTSELGTGRPAAEAGSPAGNRFVGTWLGALPIPLPESYVSGLDLQQSDFENASGVRRSYLHGQWNDRGFWHYYVYGLATRMSTGSLLLLALALAVGCTRHVPWKTDDLYAAVPAACIVFAVSMQVGFSQHFRYVLPALPFLFVLASRSAENAAGAHKRLMSAVAFCGIMAASEAVAVFPHTLSFFNVLAGGPNAGARHMLHSNVDAGQDLRHLARWLADRPHIDEIVVDGEANVPLTCIEPPGCRFLGADRGDPDGASRKRHKVAWYAVSVNRLFGEDEWYRRFRRMEQVDRVGYSMFVFRVATADGLGP